MAVTILEALRMVLDQVDYLAGNCRVNEPVGGGLTKEILALARENMAQGEQEQPSRMRQKAIIVGVMGGGYVDGEVGITMELTMPRNTQTDAEQIFADIESLMWSWVWLILEPVDHGEPEEGYKKDE